LTKLSIYELAVPLFWNTVYIVCRRTKLLLMTHSYINDRERERTLFSTSERWSRLNICHCQWMRLRNVTHKISYTLSGLKNA